MTANHGKNLKEHGEYIGHKGLYDNIIRIPLIVRLPGRKGYVREELVQHIDIAPTIYKLARVNFFHLKGVNLLDNIIPVRKVISVENTQQKTMAIRDSKWKLIIYLEKYVITSLKTLFNYSISQMIPMNG